MRRMTLGFIGLILAGCTGGSISRSAGALTGSTPPEIKESVKDGTVAEKVTGMFELPDGAIEAARDLGKLDERVFGYTYVPDPQKCPYGILSWDWFWKCKDGKLKEAK